MKEKFQKIYQVLKRIAYKIGNFQSRVILAILYFTIVAPYGIAMRFFSDRLRLKKTSSLKGWIKRKSDSIVVDISNMKNQF